ncbi:MAG: hypothetical protein DRP09_13030 [Candidatus Thorarchaeota archaeon]|nr:MAG: hypothetical protein DRP09_13030 [Candidatus Thorarchaeota archaeon]
MKFQRGDLLLVRNYSWVGGRIRQLTNSPYNHVGMFVTPRIVAEAKFSGVALTPLSKFIQSKQKGKLDFAVWRWKNVTPKQIEIMVDYVEQQVGCKYDFLQLLCLGVYIILGVPLTIEPIDLRHSWICSELVAEAADTAKIRLSDKIDPDNTAPGDIVKSGLLYRVYFSDQERMGSN